MSDITVDPMTTAEFRVEHAIRNLMDATQELNDLRRSNEARHSLMDRRNASDIELVRDRLSRIIDDVRGVA